MNQQEFLDEIGDDIHNKMDYATYEDVIPILEKIESYIASKNAQLTELLADCISDLYGTAGCKFRKKTALKLMKYVHENNIETEGVSR